MFQNRNENAQRQWQKHCCRHTEASFCSHAYLEARRPINIFESHLLEKNGMFVGLSNSNVVWKMGSVELLHKPFLFLLIVLTHSFKDGLFFLLFLFFKSFWKAHLVPSTAPTYGSLHQKLVSEGGNVREKPDTSYFNSFYNCTRSQETRSVWHIEAEMEVSDRCD